MRCSSMMNSERLSVGIQGLGIGEVAYQSAVAYAKDRLQGRSLSGAKHPEKSADPIIVHPDVRRMLMTMRAYNEGCRALGVWVANALDHMERLPESPERSEAEDFIALMTPVVKALFTDLGFEAANLGLQTYGGHGFIVDHGMEQFVRDARIAMIYEGTNGVQALDLVGRKMPANMGRSLRRFFHPVAGIHRGARRGSGRSARWCNHWQRPSARCSWRPASSPRRVSAIRKKPARHPRITCGCWDWWRSDTCGSAWPKWPPINCPAAEGEDAAFYQAKRTTARASTSIASCPRSAPCCTPSSPARPR